MSDTRETKTISVSKCARCDQDHGHLMFFAFTKPIQDSDGTVWNWWATCPVTNDPILLRVEDK